MAVRRNTRSPQTTGEPEPRPGTSTFHRTFFVSLHSIGGSALGPTPVLSGPRHCPHADAADDADCADIAENADAAATNASDAAAVRRVMSGSYGCRRAVVDGEA